MLRLSTKSSLVGEPFTSYQTLVGLGLSVLTGRNRRTGVAAAAPTLDVDIDVYDFFSGCGGTSAGLRLAGLHPRVAVDFDPDSIETFRLNFPTAVPLLRDVTGLQTAELEHLFDRERRRPVLFCACAPCQPFSKQNRQKQADDARAPLLKHLRRFIERFRPELLFVENVPGLASADDPRSPLAELKLLLSDLNYFHDLKIVYAQDYGVPQARRRLLVVASQFGPIELPKPTHGSAEVPHPTVRDAIGDLPAIRAGEVHPSMPDHVAADLSDINLLRIRTGTEGGNWRDWRPELRLTCHKALKSKGFTDVYGRMSWSRPAPPLTTRCISLSNGRFGHPEQDRAISVREAARLQSFDDNFLFVGSKTSMAKQIGNAVPVRLAKMIGDCFKQHVARYLPVHGQD